MLILLSGRPGMACMHHNVLTERGRGSDAMCRSRGLDSCITYLIRLCRIALHILLRLLGVQSACKVAFEYTVGAECKRRSKLSSLKVTCVFARSGTWPQVSYGLICSKVCQGPFLWAFRNQLHSAVDVWCGRARVGL